MLMFFTKLSSLNLFFVNKQKGLKERDLVTRLGMTKLLNAYK